MDGSLSTDIERVRAALPLKREVMDRNIRINENVNPFQIDRLKQKVENLELEKIQLEQ